MIIVLKKFGDVLTSRQSGKEAYSAFLPTLKSLPDTEKLIIDFEDINTFSPSWGDEFITPIQKEYGERLTIKLSTNLSVLLTMTTLEKVNGFKFKKA